MCGIEKASGEMFGVVYQKPRKTFRFPEIGLETATNILILLGAGFLVICLLFSFLKNRGLAN
jgi:hypothetical protein